MKVKIIYSRKSEKFLLNNSSEISENEVESLLIKAVKHLFKLEITNINIKRLQGEFKNYFRIRRGKIRIIFKVIKDEIYIVSVENIDFRGEVYK